MSGHKQRGMGSYFRFSKVTIEYSINVYVHILPDFKRLESFDYVYKKLTKVHRKFFGIEMKPMDY